MRIKYNRDQKIKGNLTRNFDKDYAFLEKALDRSGDIVKNVFYVGDTADIQSIMEAVSYTHLDVYKRQLWNIAKHYGTTIEKMKQYNENLTEPLETGQKL